MALNQIRCFFYKFNLYIIVVAAIYGCAAQQRPQGGPRDRTPPKILKATPENMTRNFSSKSIRIDFDEFFRLINQYQEISISPAMEKQPEYLINRRSLVVNFKDTLQKNTTYVINFGKAIADVNEGNVLPNFTYVFSTGAHIDSLSITGNVTNTITQEREKEATVMLFPLKQDSLLFGKKKPGIFTATDSAGNFSLNNLHDGAYRIYALKEASPNKIYDNDQELIAFSKNIINLSKDTSGIQLRLFKQVPEKFRLKENRFDPDGKLNFIFNKRLANPSIKILYPPGLDEQKIVDISRTKDTAFVYLRKMDFDSVRVAFFDNNKPLDTIYKLKGRNESFDHRLNFNFSINKDYKIRPYTDLAILPNFPIQSVDAEQITLTEDSAAINNFTLLKDTASTRGYLLKYRFRPASKYIITIKEGAFTSIYGEKNKLDKRTFQVEKQENFSQLTIKINLPDTGRNYIVELLDLQKNILRSDIIKKNTSLVYKNILTSKYRVRVIYDVNKNGRWDSGNVKNRIQPETIWLSEKEITLRPNWEGEETIDIPKEPVIP